MLNEKLGDDLIESCIASVWAQEEIKAGLSGNSNVTLQVYEGQDHAFARPGGDHYDQAAAELANSRSIELLKGNLTP